MKCATVNSACLLLVALFGLSCGRAAHTGAVPSVQFLSSPGAESLSLPFSEAVRVRGTLYLSGQIGNIPGSKTLAPGGIAGETKQTLENIKAILERHGSSLDRVAKCTVFLADINDWPEMNEVYRTYFAKNPPARSAIAASGLALGARVEIECIAVAHATE